MKYAQLFVALLLCALAALPAAAQTQAASLRGSVHDSSGAVIPGAKLTLTNIDQNRPWSTDSNEAGQYIFQQIPPGNYSLRVEADGFKRYQRPRFILNVAQVAELDVSLEIGDVTETTETTAEARCWRRPPRIWARSSTPAPPNRCRSTAATSCSSCR